MSVFDALVGQPEAVATLHAAVAAAQVGGPGMTHAWLFTGPPGSGRSVAARAFAAALQCDRGGCGECPACHTVLAGTHPDVQLVVPEGLHLTIDQARDLVRRAGRAPVHRRWQVCVVEDADRMEERTSNTLLKAIEEPPPRGVFLLCAPAADDLLPTIRSRCRPVALRLPRPAAVTEVLVREGVDPAMAAFVATAAQGHVGRARRLATDEQARRRRREALDLAGSLGSVPDCLVAAADLVATASEDAADQVAPLDAAEAAALAAVAAPVGNRRGSAGAVRDLERRQKSRSTRVRRDALDRALVDLASFYRDVLVHQLDPTAGLVNEDVRPAVTRIAAASTPESSVRRIRAVLDCRTAIDANVTPQLAVEALTLQLRQG